MRVLIATIGILALNTFVAAAAGPSSTEQYLVQLRVLNGADAVLTSTVAFLGNNEAYLCCLPNVGMDLALGYYLRIMPGGIESPASPDDTNPGSWQNLPQRVTSSASKFECCGVRFVVYVPKGTQFEVVVKKLPPVTLVDGKALPEPPGQDDTPVELGRLSAPMQ